MTATPASDWASSLDRAREAVAAALPPTPLIPSPRLGEGVLLKLETFQPTGSFKVRGALAAVTMAGNPLGVVTASTGNHALGIAWAARRPGIPAAASPAMSAALRAGLVVPATTLTGRKAPMTLELINPEGLPTPSPYTHVVVAAGGKTVFIAGQEPEDAHGNLIGPGDLAAQARQVFANLRRALAAAGAHARQVTKITIYVVHHRPEYLPVIEEARAGVFGDHKPADTLVGVETLAQPGYLIEVDAIAVIDS